MNDQTRAGSPCDRRGMMPLPFEVPMALPIKPPFPPMEAQLVPSIPEEGDWQYEPKWDGFRCLAFRDGDRVELQSKAGQPLARYFPEIVAAVKDLPAKQFVLDG